MQIDFHHTVIFILARLAGFGLKESNLIAACSQFVDDATDNEVIRFENGESYQSIYSAHSHLDYKNFDELDNHHIWIPFHFLPNGMQQNTFYDEICCRPNSRVAQDMLAECLRQKNMPNALYRLGVTMHVFADTWAHQGFAGIKHEQNKVFYCDDNETSTHLADRIKDFFEDSLDNVTRQFPDKLLPLGHGAVLTYPDLPFLQWEYKTIQGQLIKRDNTAIFLDAINHIFIYLQQFLGVSKPVELPPIHMKKFQELLSKFDDKNGDTRHQQWMEAIKESAFGEIGSIDEIQISKWKSDALHTLKDTSYFAQTSWKYFQDSLKEHHFYMLHLLDEKYHICVA